MQLVASMINAVVIEVQHIMHLQQFTAFFAIEPHEVLARDGRAAFLQGRFQNLAAIGGAQRTLVIHPHSATITVG